MTEGPPTPPAPSGAATVAIRLRWTVIFPLTGALIGLVAAFIIGPLVALLLNLIGDAPGPLRLAALLPLAWAIPVLMIVGVVAGFVFLGQWHEEAGKVYVDARGVTVEHRGGKQRVARERIGEVFTDGTDLVIVDPASRELLRSKTDDELAAQLGEILERYSYPYVGNRDPREEHFVAWVDGEDVLDVDSEALLRDRHRAQLDEQAGRMQQLAEDLAERGITVRDRKDGQQYRVAEPPERH